MTTPERIWAWAWTDRPRLGQWTSIEEQAGESREYIRRDATFTSADLARAYEMGRDDAAKSAGTYCHLRTVQGGRLKSPAVFTTHTWQEIQDCIRVLTPPADLAKRLGAK